MNKESIIKAWKSKNYRHRLSSKEQELIPENPVGMVELSDADLAYVAGGNLGTEHILTLGCCGGLTRDRSFCGIISCDRTQSQCTCDVLCSSVIEEPVENLF